MAEWFAVGVSLLAIAQSLILRYGVDARRNGKQDARMDSIENDLRRGFDNDRAHFQHAQDDQVHFQDTELHWTSRERDELTRRLDKQEAMQGEILREIRVLGERMYGK